MQLTRYDYRPSSEALAARAARIRAARQSALALAARRARFFPPIVGPLPHPFTTTDRPHECINPNAGRNVRYIGSNCHA